MTPLQYAARAVWTGVCLAALVLIPEVYRGYDDAANSAAIGGLMGFAFIGAVMPWLRELDAVRRAVFGERDPR